MGRHTQYIVSLSQEEKNSNLNHRQIASALNTTE